MNLKNNINVKINDINYNVLWVRKKNYYPHQIKLFANKYSSFVVYTSYNQDYEGLINFLNENLPKFIQKVNKKLNNIRYYLNLQTLTFCLFGKQVDLKQILPNEIDWQRFQGDSTYRKQYYSLLNNWLIKYGQKIFEMRLKAWFKTMGYTHQIPQVQYKWLNYKWGSYSNKQQLVFNTKLFCFPLEIIDCIIVHELCHIRHMHHQASFYNEMKKYLPNYLQLEKNLIYIV